MDSDLRKKLVEEFRSIFEAGEYLPSINTFGVVALSAAPLKDKEDNIITEASPDNSARIQYSIDIIKSIVMQRKAADTITLQDIIEYAPMLVLNGETEQLPTMMQIAAEYDFPSEKIMVVNCGDRGVGNTKTQFVVLNMDSRLDKVTHLTFVTNPWHMPRVLRTADANLRPSLSFDVIPVPDNKIPYNAFSVLRGEIRRIESYSSKGDISRYVTRRK